MSYLVTEWKDDITGATGFLVIDKILNGFCAGGIRMRKGVHKEEVQRLASIMTVKMAGLGLNIGGAKGGIDFDNKDPRAKDVLARYLEAHLVFIEKLWLTSEDLGTREEDILEILKKFGLDSSVQSYIEQSSNKESIQKALKTALTSTYDELPLTDLVTGYGVMATTLQVLKYEKIDFNQAKVAIQGFGSVGASAAKFLFEQGVKIVAIADIEGTIFNADGLDVSYLLNNKNKFGVIERSSLPEEYQLLDGKEWLEADVDVLIPSAIADAINLNNYEQVKANWIIEGGNITVTAEAEELLYKKGVRVIPDFIANSGGAGLFVAVLTEGVNGEPLEVFEFLDKRLSKTTNTIIELSDKHSIIPRQAAYNLTET